MPKFTEKLAKELLRPIHKRDVLLLSTYTSLWGIWVFNPYWDTFGRSKIYNSLNYIFPEWVWGLTIALIGLSSMAIVIHGCNKTLGLISKAGFILWGIITMFYISADITSTAWITSFTLSSFYLLMAVNIAINKEKAIDVF